MIISTLVMIGIISLLISILSFQSKLIPDKEKIVTMFFPADCNEFDKYQFRYSTCQMEQTIRKKKKMNFILDRDTAENKRKFPMIQYEALKLKFTRDTSTVIVIKFTNDTFYGDILRLVNICVSDKHSRYGIWNDKFVIFGEWPKVKPIENEISLLYM